MEIFTRKSKQWTGSLQSILFICPGTDRLVRGHAASPMVKKNTNVPHRD